VQEPGSTHNDQRARRRRTVSPALAAGFLVIAVAASLIIFSDFRGLLDPVLETENSDEGSDAEVVELEDTSESLDPSPNANSVYIEGDVGFPTTLNPLMAASSTERSISALLFRSLMVTNGNGEPEPDLASSWTVSDDGLTHTIELDPEARWHDGQQVSTADVLFTISLLRDEDFPGAPDLSRFWRGVSAEATGDREITFTLLEPYIGFVHHLHLPILPRHQYGDMLASDLAQLTFLNSDLVGSGAFRLQKIDASAGEIHLERERDGTDGTFSEVVFRYFDTRDEAMTAFRDGEIDGVSYVPLSLLDSESRFPANAQIFGSQISGHTALYFNVRHRVFEDVNTRRAIDLAIDRDGIVDQVLGGHAIPGSSPVPKLFSAHADHDFSEPDLEAAAELLELDGWTLADGDEVRQRDGEYFEIPLIVNDDDPQRIAVAEQVQDQLAKIGIAVDLQVMPVVEVEAALNTRQFGAVIYGWHTDNGNLDGYQLWHSSQAEDGHNFTGFSDVDADEALTAARQATTIDERNQAYEMFQSVFAEQVPAVVLFYPRYHFAVSERVAGAEPVPLVHPGDRIRQIPKWYERGFDAPTSGQ
jgi:peptide/nickel transport system substrate-binding protein